MLWNDLFQNTSDNALILVEVGAVAAAVAAAAAAAVDAVCDF